MADAWGRGEATGRFLSGIEVIDHLKKNYERAYAAGGSDWRRAGALGKVDNIVALCSQLPHDSALEIGAGEGAILERLSELKFSSALHALEISPTGVEAIEKKEIPELVECALFDGYEIPFGDDAFDLAILSHVLEHAEYPRKLLYEASRVAKYVCVEVPLEDTWRLSGDFVLDPVGHINFYSTKTFRRLLQTCDLEILGQLVANPRKDVFVYRDKRTGLFKYLIKEALLRLSPRLATRLFTYHFALVCRRVGKAPRARSAT
jgi:ubiquinone/menaquinone biosynthesis C-methylase UbiE